MKTLFERMMDASGGACFPGLIYGEDGIGRGASFNEDRAHRLTLRRHSDVGHRWAFCGVNPSDAGEESDDPTVRKLYGFGRRLGVGFWELVNKFSLVASDINQLRSAGPNLSVNNEYIQHAFVRADRIVVGWGRLDKLPPELRTRWRDVVELAAGRPLWCWGTCDDGHPRHPARIPYDTPLQPWTPPL